MNQSQGESLFMQGKIDEAVVELQKEAKMGAPRAMYLIGCCLREGYGHVEADERKAVKWFQKGYEEGSALCGISLVNGTDDQEMWDIVNECFPRVLKAAVSGDVLAMDEAGHFYLGALIVNFEEGMKWLTKAALAEYWRALYDLGSAYEEGYAVPRNEERAMLCFKKAAEFHDQYSEYKVGEMLLNSWKKEKDTKKAAEWLKSRGNTATVKQPCSSRPSMKTATTRKTRRKPSAGTKERPKPASPKHSLNLPTITIRALS